MQSLINSTQALLERAAEERACARLIESADIRESIAPLERRRFNALAAVIARTPLDRRGR